MCAEQVAFGRLIPGIPSSPQAGGLGFSIEKESSFH